MPAGQGAGPPSGSGAAAARSTLTGAAGLAPASQTAALKAPDGPGGVRAHAASLAFSMLTGFEAPLGGNGSLPFAFTAGEAGGLPDAATADASARAPRDDGSSWSPGHLLPLILGSPEQLIYALVIFAALAALLATAYFLWDPFAAGQRGRAWRFASARPWHSRGRRGLRP